MRYHTLEDYTLKSWFLDNKIDCLQGYLFGRYKVFVESEMISQWVVNYREENKDFEVPVSIREWLKNRLIDSGVLKAMSVGQPEIRFVTLLHGYPTEEETTFTAEDIVYSKRFLSSSTVRSRFHSLRSRRPIGINVAARRMVNEQLKTCPYCSTRFRNPNALTLHLESRHAVDIVRSLS